MAEGRRCEYLVNFVHIVYYECSRTIDCIAMLHLLPIRVILLIIIILTAAIVLVLFEVEFFLDKILYVLRWASLASLCAMIIPCIAWRFVPLLQRGTVPYLGGHWEGVLHYNGPHGYGTLNIIMDIRHSLFRIKIMLDAEESTSKTLAVYVERDTGINRHRLHYIYVNERKDGLKNAGDTYRGLALLGVVNGSTEIRGNYFTERTSKGTLELKRRRTHAWWIPLR